MEEQKKKAFELPFTSAVGNWDNLEIFFLIFHKNECWDHLIEPPHSDSSYEYFSLEIRKFISQLFSKPHLNRNSEFYIEMWA